MLFLGNYSQVWWRLVLVSVFIYLLYFCFANWMETGKSWIFERNLSFAAQGKVKRSFEDKMIEKCFLSRRELGRFSGCL
jgi:hypothetical protein